MKNREQKKLLKDIQRRDSRIDKWVDDALESSSYTRDLLFRCVTHVISKQNEDIKRSIDIEHNKRSR